MQGRSSAQLWRVEVTSAAEAREVFRFVRCADLGDDRLSDDFLSDRAMGKIARGRAARLPELMDGMSAFRSAQLARARWNDLAALASNRGETVRVGNYVARVVLSPSEGFAYEDLGRPDGHLTIWGDAVKLARSAVEIFPADS